MKNAKPETIAAQSLGWIDEITRAVSPPIHLSSTFIRDPDNQFRSGREYARSDNPTYDQPEAVLAALENGKDAMLLASGMAAASACFLALRPGDHVVIPKVMYWGLRLWLFDFAVSWGLDVEAVEMSDLDAVKAAMRPGKTKLVWIESPGNPMWNITDIAAVAEIAKKAGAKAVADSTVATPVLTRPLDLGCDVVMHSATKYLNGHSDIVMGALVTKAEDDYWQALSGVRSRVGGIPGSFEAWLLLRGMRTLYPRVKAACANAQKIAEHFTGHPRIAEVLYPGLRNHPGHAVAAKQMTGGFSGMLSIRIKSGEDAAIATAARVKLWKRATSLGGTESLIEHRGSTEGPGAPCPMDLLRLSAGIEHAADLIADLEQALDGNG
ncbi:MAG: aminotransferase class V-fold PLP-dependent enzyme [Proteobacteria bacterium]|nr:aminotransferase class V-fold PLP-dependent enzyme [Pseudomonadota bacterium]